MEMLATTSAPMGAVPGTGEPTALIGFVAATGPVEEGQDRLPERVVELAESVVRALQPGSRYCSRSRTVWGVCGES
jgi:hypothetical protein